MSARDQIGGDQLLGWIRALPRALERRRDFIDRLDYAAGNGDQPGTDAYLAALEAARHTRAGTLAQVCAALVDLLAAHGQGIGGLVLLRVARTLRALADRRAWRPVDLNALLTAVAADLHALAIPPVPDDLRHEVNQILAGSAADPQGLDCEMVATAWLSAVQWQLMSCATPTLFLGAVMLSVARDITGDQDEDAVAVPGLAPAADPLTAGVERFEPAGPSVGPLRVDARVTLGAPEARRLAERLGADPGGGVMVCGRDLLGAGEYHLYMRASALAQVRAQGIDQAHVFCPYPAALREGAPVHAGRVRLLEPVGRGARVEPRPGVVVLAGAGGIADELARAGAHVCWGVPEWTGDLAVLVRSLGKGVVAVVAAGAAQAARAERVAQELGRAERAVDVVVVACHDDLEAYHVALALTQPACTRDMATLQRSRARQAVAEITTCALGPDTPLARLLPADQSAQPRVIVLSSRADPGAGQRVADALHWLDVEIRTGGQPGPAIMGIVDA